MPARLLAALALTALALSGCSADDRFDGGSATHSDDPMYQMEGDRSGETSATDPFTTPTEAEVVEPLDPSTTAPAGPPASAPTGAQTEAPAGTQTGAPASTETAQ